MKPVNDTQDALVALLDRILDKGLILDADIIIHVAGIPLVGLKLTAALAGIETMIRYGIWEDWDKAQRGIAAEEYAKENTPLVALLRDGKVSSGNINQKKRKEANYGRVQ